MKCVCSNLRKGGASSLQRIALDGVFTAILVALGMIKLPSLFPGAEFQLSAPYAVCLAAMVGFKRYLIIGICSSIIQLLGVIDNMDNTKKPRNTELLAVTLTMNRISVSDQHRHIKMDVALA